MDNEIGGYLEAQYYQDVHDIKRLVMAWVGATERKRRGGRRDRRRRRGGEDG